MKFIKIIFRHSLCPVLALIMAVSLTGGAAAATLRIKPDQLKKVGNVQKDVRLPFVVGSSTENVAYYYLLKLPVGTKLKGLEYQHSGNILPETLVSVVRSKPTASPGFQFILQGQSNEETPSGVHLVWVEADFFPGAVRRVKRGWTYFVFVECDDGSFVGDIKVFYE